MATNAVATQNAASVMDEVIGRGDLRHLTPEQRVIYYHATCESLGLNPLTKPFDYINLSGKLTLYATKGATDQLRAKHGISVRVVSQEVDGDVLVVTVEGTDGSGRVDSEIGAVSVGGLRGDALANARMKALTKAKRRLTLSMAGLGMLDESELETVRDYQPVRVDMDSGEVLEVQARPARETLEPAPAAQAPQPAPARAPSRAELIDLLSSLAAERGLSWDEVQDLAVEWVGKGSDTQWTRADWQDIQRHIEALPVVVEAETAEEAAS